MSGVPKQQKVHAFLKHHPMGVLSTVDQDGKPWGAAVYYVADEDFNFYFVTRAETFKYHNLSANPLAAMTVADEPAQTTVQASGTISEVPVEDYMDIVFTRLDAIRPKDNPNWAPPLSKIRAGNYMPLRLTPDKLQYADYKDVKSDSHADYIERIL
jgi:nitroimidazol reductase NimA-like FMN-containing flavoprotein (pyridoxamine 5'-phosphate oxidase superfamily)